MQIIILKQLHITRWLHVILHWFFNRFVCRFVYFLMFHLEMFGCMVRVPIEYEIFDLNKQQNVATNTFKQILLRTENSKSANHYFLWMYFNILKLLALHSFHRSIASNRMNIIWNCRRHVITDQINSHCSHWYHLIWLLTSVYYVINSTGLSVGCFESFENPEFAERSEWPFVM